jgi:hypothetical protein
VCGHEGREAQDEEDDDDDVAHAGRQERTSNLPGWEIRAKLGRCVERTDGPAGLARW